MFTRAIQLARKACANCELPSPFVKVTNGLLGSFEAETEGGVTVTALASGRYQFVFNPPFKDATYSISPMGADGDHALFEEESKTSSGVIILTTNSAGTVIGRKFSVRFSN